MPPKGSPSGSPWNGRTRPETERAEKDEVLKATQPAEILSVCLAPMNPQRVLADRKARVLRETTDHWHELICCPGGCGGQALLESPTLVTRDGQSRMVRVAECQGGCRTETRVGRSGRVRMVPNRFDLPLEAEPGDPPLPDLKGEKRPHLEGEKRPDLEDEKRPNLESEKRLNLESEKRPNLEDEKRPDLESKKRPDLESKKRPNLEDEKRPDLEGDERPENPRSGRPAHPAAAAGPRTVSLARPLSAKPIAHQASKPAPERWPAAASPAQDVSAPSPAR